MNKLRMTKLALLLAGSALLFSCGSKPVKEEPEVTQTVTAPTTQDSVAFVEEFDAASNQKFQNAITSLKNEQFDDAIKQLSKLNNRNSPARVDANLALAYFKTADLEKAVESINSAIRKKPNSADFLNLSAIIAIEEGRFKDAEKALKKALSSNSEHPLANYNMALLYDIYYQEIPKAYNYYLKYLNLVNYEDKETVQWVEQLRYSIGE